MTNTSSQVFLANISRLYSKHFYMVITPSFHDRENKGNKIGGFLEKGSDMINSSRYFFSAVIEIKSIYCLYHP